MVKSLSLTPVGEALLLAVVTSFLLASAASKAPSLGHYNIERDEISVSGLSSGAFFAVQFHVAYSSTIMGVAAVAGGPFWCAQDNLQIALSSCMRTPAGIAVSFLINVTYATALSGTIDNPANMKKHKIFIFSGNKDTVVDPGVSQKLVQYYEHFSQDGVFSEFSIPAEHAMVTNEYGSSCSFLGSPYINNCGYSAAYHILEHIYGDIKDANSSHIDENNLLEFDQSEFFAGFPKLVSLDNTGYIYVPTSCQDDNKRKCRLHISFHGCKQGRESVSTKFALHSGYNGLAETNGIIILYPQAVRSADIPYNPDGCWDWWGYSAPSYASKLGPQMAGIKLMLNRIVNS